MQREHFFARLWEDFVQIAPQAAALRRMLLESGEHVENDHVAFRTLARPGLGIGALEGRILDLGYTPLDDYEFPDKHLRARAYLCEGSPRIFLSELIVEKLSKSAQALLDRLAQQAVRALPAGPEIFWAGRLWQPLTFADYEMLAEESEYASWLAALGLRPNHFTVSINALRRLRTVEAVLGFAEAAGYRINKAGGRVKGTPMDLLEQGATLAEQVPVEFEGGERHEIPTCYYEFALRHRGAGGELYQGFVPTSANRIFESTNRR